MEIKPSKSGSISIVKGQLAYERFHINNKLVPTILEKHIKSLGRWYSAELKDSKQVEQLKQDTISGLSLSHANRLERLVNVQVRKWLGLPRCLSSIGLYGNGVLSLPISSLVEEYKCAKARLEMTLTESRDPFVRGAAPTLATGRKWKPSAAVAEAKTSLRHRDIVGHVQHGKNGLGMEATTPTWQKATPAERRHMVVEEVRHQEEAARCAKAVSQAQQGCWMKWEGVERRRITWSKLWSIEASWLSFTIRAVYDVLSSPTNLHLWIMSANPAPSRSSSLAMNRELIQGFVDWSLRNNLQINAGKTKELVVDFRRRNNPPPAPVNILGTDVDVVESYKYLGVHLNNNLDWSHNTDALVKKGNSRLFLLRRVRSFGVQGPLLRTFYDSVVGSAIFYGIVCWSSSITDRDRKRMDRLVRRTSSVRLLHPRCVKERSWGQQPKQRGPDFHLPSYFFQLIRGDPQAFPDIERHSLSNMSYRRDMP
ncbi:hypothetical protein D4764_03G0006320 [Takifugu flavidus]|uniref:Alkylated DNA repair protein AlkB homologue 8 N-terminal domain-containing protein n=1 Tax=Takifugu flavidus TaxID=433684 RepID=A0A5C6N809_9TELE|nr:hypothetical protein D4764_03G0006320 [Takifugu flavidus]